MNAPVTFGEARRIPVTAEMFASLFMAGLLPDSGRTELREGEIVNMSPVNIAHATAVVELGAALLSAIKAAKLPFRGMGDPSVRTDEFNVPQPDLVIWEPTGGNGFAPVEAVKLAIEISDTTLRDDLGRKKRHYAKVGIPEYWVVDLNERVIRQHCHPHDGDYATTHSVEIGAPLSSLTISGLTVDTSEL